MTSPVSTVSLPVVVSASTSVFCVGCNSLVRAAGVVVSVGAVSSSLAVFIAPGGEASCVWVLRTEVTGSEPHSWTDGRVRSPVPSASVTGVSTASHVCRHSLLDDLLCCPPVHSVSPTGVTSGTMSLGNSSSSTAPRESILTSLPSSTGPRNKCYEVCVGVCTVSVAIGGGGSVSSVGASTTGYAAGSHDSDSASVLGDSTCVYLSHALVSASASSGVPIKSV